MEQKSKIILERICRALISLIPIAGSPIEQLTFGIKESIEGQELLQRIFLIETKLRELSQQGLSDNNLLETILQSGEFAIAQNIVDGLTDRRLPQPAPDADRYPVVQRLFLALKNDLVIVKSEIEKIESENLAIFQKLNADIQEVEHAEKHIDAVQTLISFRQINLQAIHEAAKKCYTAHKLALRKRALLLVPPIAVANYLEYPLDRVNEASLFWEYTILLNLFPCRFLDSDSVELFNVRRYFQRHPNRSGHPVNYDLYRAKKINDFFSKMISPETIVTDIPEPQNKTQIQNLLIKHIFENQDRFDHHYRQALRLNFLEVANKEKPVYFMPVALVIDQQIQQLLRSAKMIRNLASRQETGTYEILAMASFFRKRRHSLADLDTFHRVARLTRENKSSKERTALSTYQGALLLKKDMQLIYNYLKSFKTDLKAIALYPLYEAEQQIAIANRAYYEFFSAYGEIDTNIKDLIRSLEVT